MSISSEDLMLALVKAESGSGHLALKRCPVPAANAGQVRIRVRAVGVCGSDIHMRDGMYPCRPPLILGHELAGTVDALGVGISEFEAGDRVVSETYFHVCGHCFHCTTGHQNLCLERTSIGSGVDGAMAEYVVVPAHRLHKLPRNLTFEEGAVIEPYVCCVQAVFGKTALQVGDSVLVGGPGVMGLICVQLLHLIGCRVVVTGTSSDSARLDLSKRLGADQTLFVEDPKLLDAISDFSKGIGVSAAFECSGAPAASGTCLGALRKGGTMIQVALPNQPVAIDLSAIAQHEKVITGSFATLPHWWTKGLQLLEDSKIELRPFVSGVFPLIEWEKAFRKMESHQGFKYVLTP